MHSIIIDNNQMEKVHGMTSEYPYVMHITDLRTRYMVPWHWHEEFEIFCVTSGAVRITTENAEYIVNKGEVSVSPRFASSASITAPTAIRPSATVMLALIL